MIERIRSSDETVSGAAWQNAGPYGAAAVEPLAALMADEDFNMNHKADWFRSIRKGYLRPAVDIEIGHRTATLCNLGNLSYLLGRKLVWDGVKQEVVGDEQANRLLSRPQRYPYVL